MSQKIALVTGGSRGIGAAVARLAAQAGYDVAVNFAVDSKAGDAVVADCRAQGVRSVALQADVGNPDAVGRLFVECDERLGRVDLLVNNAGIVGAATSVEDLDAEVLHRTFDVNVHGSVLCAQQAIRRMSIARGGRGGVIVNLSSIAATLGSPGEYVHYAASKGAIDAFTIGLAKEVAAVGIRVNAVQAGTTATEIHARSGNPTRLAMVANTAPLGRVATPEDIAEAILWLASDRASYATGTILRLGGGL